MTAPVPPPPADDPGGIGEMITETKHEVCAAIIKAAPRTDPHRDYQPSSIRVVWKRSAGAAGRNSWRCGWITLFGPQIRKDGTLGTRELHETIWVRDGRPEQHPTQRPCPTWAWDFYERSMPTWGRTTL